MCVLGVRAGGGGGGGRKLCKNENILFLVYCCFSCGTGTLFFLVYPLHIVSCIFLNTLPLIFSHLMWKMLENVVKCMCRPENSAIQN